VTGRAIAVGRARRTAPYQEIPDKGDLDFSPGVAYSARVNNVWQGGKDNSDPRCPDLVSGTYMGVISEFSGGRS